jgi:hypothetical protein
MPTSPSHQRRYPFDLTDAQMGPDRRAAAPTNQAGTSRKTPPPRDRQRHPLHRARRLRVADAAQKTSPLGRPCSGISAAGATTLTVDRIHNTLRDNVRDVAGRDPMASTGIIDAQSVKGADTVGKDSRGFDAGKKVNGRKRHVVVDTLGLLLVVMVTAANVQDRDGGKRLLERLRFVMPSVAHIWADGGYAGRLVAYAHKVLRRTLEVVRKPAGQRGFEVLARRW